MNDILKQRLVGALVLIALGVVFWPVVFVETERGSMDRSTQLEPMPRLEEVAIPAPEPLQDVEPVSAADRIAEAAARSAEPEPAVEAAPVAAAQSEQSSQPKPKPQPRKEPKPEPKPAPKTVARTAPVPASPALDEDGIPIAWVLQVASLSSREKADQLTEALIAQDYKAYSRAIRRDGTVLYRVFVGPVFEREKLAAAKRDIDRQLNVSAIIARYVP